MATTGRSNDTYILWGGSLSYYTGKARSYLIKKRIPYREFYPAHPVFQEKILPALGFFVVPVLEAPDGSIIQDTSDIIEHLEERFPEPRLNPSAPVQRTIAALIGAFGSEGLLKPGMHYRWSFLAQQENFLRVEFGRCASASHDRTQRDAAAAPFMQAMQAHLPRLGIIGETIPAIERSYEDLLAVLDAHFLMHPYVLGGRPSDADFGLMAPLFAHLGRDPYPCALMKSRAPNVFRWTERMNLADLFDGEFPETEPCYPADDAIPETLEPLLAHIFRDWGPELLANSAQYNAWIAAHPSLKPGDLVAAQGERQLHPALGEISFTLCGRTIRAGGAPQALWHFNKTLARARALTGAAKARFDALIQRTGGERVMALTLARPLKRENYVLVVG
ncbi:MAG: glutathione S-transferase family protein [Candidatus Binatia bacterium]